jgi:hypothetical protein
MPHAKPDELPNGGGGRWPAAGDNFRSVQWGDMEVGYTTTGPLDCTQLYQVGGLPGGVCTCPHYGYIFEGSIRATYPNTDWADDAERRRTGRDLLRHSLDALTSHGSHPHRGMRRGTPSLSAWCMDSFCGASPPNSRPR